VNCHVEISGSCLGGDIGGVRVEVEDGLATGDGVVLGAGVIFLFSHKRVELLLFFPSISMFIKDILDTLPLSLYLASKNYSSFFSSISGLDGCGSVGTARVDTIVFRAVVFLLLFSSAICLGCTILLVAAIIILCVCNSFHVVGFVHSMMLIPF
jgi:hypothetical protein